MQNGKGILAEFPHGRSIKVHYPIGYLMIKRLALLSVLDDLLLYSVFTKLKFQESPAARSKLTAVLDPFDCKPAIIQHLISFQPFDYLLHYLWRN